MTAPTIPVTVTHIPLTRETYEELLEGLDELDRAFKVTAQTVNARRWLHYRWLLEGNATSAAPTAGGCHQ